jgi:hypothetical protein
MDFMVESRKEMILGFAALAFYKLQYCGRDEPGIGEEWAPDDYR